MCSLLKVCIFQLAYIRIHVTWLALWESVCVTVNKFNYAIIILFKIEINKLETIIVKQYKTTMSQCHNVLLIFILNQSLFIECLL